jgi:hypothetical protein
MSPEAVRQYLEAAEARLRLTSRGAPYCCLDSSLLLRKMANPSIPKKEGKELEECID